MHSFNALLLARNSDEDRAFLLGVQQRNVLQNDQTCCITSANPRRSDICGRDSVYRLALPRPCTILIRHRISTSPVALDENNFTTLDTETNHCSQPPSICLRVPPFSCHIYAVVHSRTTLHPFVTLTRSNASNLLSA
jgi:hypothetical protein